MRIVLIALLLSGCASFNPKLLSVEDRFKFQACLTVYCDSSENSVIKKSGLKLIEIALGSQNIKLDLRRGFCEKYYTQRQLENGWVWAKKSSYEICNNSEDIEK